MNIRARVLIAVFAGTSILGGFAPSAHALFGILPSPQKAEEADRLLSEHCHRANALREEEEIGLRTPARLAADFTWLASPPPYGEYWPRPDFRSRCFEGVPLLQPCRNRSRLRVGFTGCGKTHSVSRFVTGHDFSRAANAAKSMRALAPADLDATVSPNVWSFPQPLLAAEGRFLPNSDFHRLPAVPIHRSRRIESIIPPKSTQQYRRTVPGGRSGSYPCPCDPGSLRRASAP